MPAGATTPLVSGTLPVIGSVGKPSTPPVPKAPQPAVIGVETEISASPRRMNERFSGCPATASSSLTVVATSP